MNVYDVRDILDQVEYKDWFFIVVDDEGLPYYLQVQFIEANTDTGNPELQKGRKWMLSSWMTTTEIVSTAWKAILAAEEHEAREKFRYKGQAVFGPHISVDRLAEVLQNEPDSIKDVRDKD